MEKPQRCEGFMYQVYWLDQFGFNMQKQDNSATGQFSDRTIHKHTNTYSAQ